MKEATEEKLKKIDQKASKVIRVTGYIILIPIALASLLFSNY